MCLLIRGAAAARDGGDPLPMHGSVGRLNYGRERGPRVRASGRYQVRLPAVHLVRADGLGPRGRAPAPEV